MATKGSPSGFVAPLTESPTTSLRCSSTTPNIIVSSSDKIEDPEKAPPALEPSTSTDASPTIQGDDALNIVSDTIRYVTPEENRRVLRKIDRHVMPVLFIIYFLQFMDKHILALASVFGIVRETHLQGEQYSVIGSMAPIAQLVLQPLSAFFLVRFRLSIYMPILVICWGTTLACMAAARNFTGLVVSRFFLGGFETSTQAAFILMGQMWYKRQEQGLRLMIWFSNVGWVDIVGSLIMYGFGHINKGSIHSYQIAFIALGAVTAATGIASFVFFPDSPVKSKFLTQEEKVIAVERIRANQQGVETKIFKLTQVVETLLDLKSWCWMGLLILHATPTGAITVFGPLVVKGFGYDGYDTMLFLIPYGALQVIAMVLSYWVSTKIHTKSPLVLIFLIPCMIGMIILYTTGRDKEHQPALLVAYYLLAAQSAVTPTMLGWQAVNTAGHTKKASTTAMTIMGSYTGGIVGPLLFQPKDGPYYHSGILACIICYSGAATLTVFTTAYLYYLNKRNEARRVAVGKPAKLIDHSMTSAANEKDGVGSPEGSNIGKRAFEDLTDLQNDEFIYVL
ncbi:allantoate permease [Coprinellus micaceus]|uniref:Allantoate permease n=1 Tax=Coprinellus micaceus TaxID=71717 RepID=A0A4Y7TBD8_COPMI|nr:allantoate permease [Coprinellus micaceus]